MFKESRNIKDIQPFLLPDAEAERQAMAEAAKPHPDAKPLQAARGGIKKTRAQVRSETHRCDACGRDQRICGHGPD